MVETADTAGLRAMSQVSRPQGREPVRAPLRYIGNGRAFNGSILLISQIVPNVSFSTRGVKPS
jgi:hypothetical protein